MINICFTAFLRAGVNGGVFLITCWVSYLAHSMHNMWHFLMLMPQGHQVRSPVCCVWPSPEQYSENTLSSPCVTFSLPGFLPRNSVDVDEFRRKHWLGSSLRCWVIESWVNMAYRLKQDVFFVSKSSFLLFQMFNHNFTHILGSCTHGKWVLLHDNTVTFKTVSQV